MQNKIPVEMVILRICFSTPEFKKKGQEKKEII